MDERRDTAVEGEAARLFLLSFVAVLATSFGFVLRAFVIDDWGREFALTETQKGELLGAGLWPFALSIVLLSFVIDRIGFRAVFVLAAVAHFTSVYFALTADRVADLYVATVALALGNGAIEAAVNPLIATVYRHDKTRWLSMLHAGWPGGLVLGGLLSMWVGPDLDWRARTAIVVVPVLAYVLLLVGRRFPVSERVAAGVTYREMLAETGAGSIAVAGGFAAFAFGGLCGWSVTAQVAIVAGVTAAYAFYSRSFGRPLFVLMLLLMVPMSTTELGVNSWITSLMAPEMHRVGLHPGWVLIYTATLMLVLRLTAGPLIHRCKPLGVLALCSLLAALGLWTMSTASGAGILVAATLFGTAISFFWPATLGFVSEQCPRGGAVALCTIAGVAMLSVGTVGAVLLGRLQDQQVERSIVALDARAGSRLADQVLTEPRDGTFGRYRGVDAAKVAALSPAERARLEDLIGASRQRALATVALLPVIMLLVYLALIAWFRTRGGYRPLALDARPDTAR
jgi:DHA2 family metal-tetracycline-proton antiporter-like MFS transporter